MAWTSLNAKTMGGPKSEVDTGNGRRRSERRPYIIEGWLSRPNNPNDEREVVYPNISQHGVAFKLPERLEAGQFFAIEIGLGDQRLISEIRVVNCRPAEGGMFDIGGEFC